MKEIKDRIEDALAATKAASEEGIVVGGGVAYLLALGVSKDLDVSEDEKVGVKILQKALTYPLMQIASNAGKEPGEVLTKVVMEIKKGNNNYGYNAKDDKYEDLIKAGIIDPTKVTRSALQNAASAAGMFLTTEAVITDIPKPEGEAPAMGMGGGMPGMGMGGGMPMM